MATFSPFHGVRKNDRYTDQQRTPHGETETAYDQRSNDGGQSTHIGWAICKHVGPLHIAIHATVYTLLVEYADYMSTEPRRKYSLTSW